MERVSLKCLYKNSGCPIKLEIQIREKERGARVEGLFPGRCVLRYVEKTEESCEEGCPQYDSVSNWVFRSWNVFEDNRKILVDSKCEHFSEEGHDIRVGRRSLLSNLGDGIVICKKNIPFPRPFMAPGVSCLHYGKQLMKVYRFSSTLCVPRSLDPGSIVWHVLPQILHQMHRCRVLDQSS